MSTRLLLLAATALNLLSASPAGAAPSIRIAEFDVEVEGVQTVVWTKAHDQEFPCDVGIYGEGRETYRFRSARPARVRAIWSGSGVALMARHGAADVHLDAKVRRSGRIKLVPGEVCSFGDDTGPPAAPAPPDCGTQQLHEVVEPRFSDRRGLLVLDDAYTPAGRDPYVNCPSAGGWPDLLELDTTGRRVGRLLPPRDLFGFGKSIVLARGRHVSEAADGTITTTIRWSVSFRRVTPAGARPLAPGPQRR